MSTCPTCLTPLADAAAGCARCQVFTPGSPIMLTVALTPETGPGVARFDSRSPAPSAEAPSPHTPAPDRALPPGFLPPGSGERTMPNRASALQAEPPPSAEVRVPPPPPEPAVVVKLRVIRGLRMSAEYPVYPGRNVVGRFADKPVDIDLTGVEPDGQVWSSRRHAAITLDRGVVVIEDQNSLNGTWVNGTRLRAGAALPLRAGDVIQIGVAQLRVEIEPA